MVEESPPPVPPLDESIEAETDAAREPKAALVEPALAKPVFVCDCEVHLRHACEGADFYKEEKGKRYCVLHYPSQDKVDAFREALRKKIENRDFNFAGVRFPEDVDFRRFVFDSTAFFGDATFDACVDFSYATFKGQASFNYATFRGVASFHSVTFELELYFEDADVDADASFIGAKFNAATNFRGSTFRYTSDFKFAEFKESADFGSAVFGAAIFGKATFNNIAAFRSSRFSGDAKFNEATFEGPTDFGFATFRGIAQFGSAVFKDELRFLGTVAHRWWDGSPGEPMALGTNPTLDIQHTRIDKPERVSFHTLILRPHWFVNVDSRKFIFTDVSWEWDRISIKQELTALDAKEVSSPNRLLAIACRQLAENAEANNRYEEASRFRYWAMDLARRTKWKGWSFWKTDWLHMFYWAVSGYGERIRNALSVLAAVWVVFAFLYTQVGFEQKPPKPSNDSPSSATAASITVEDRIGQPLTLNRALTYSLAVMSLQKPERQPVTNWAHTLVTLEAILGPVQAALLALAIRRKFMR